MRYKNIIIYYLLYSFFFSIIPKMIGFTKDTPDGFLFKMLPGLILQITFIQVEILHSKKILANNFNSYSLYIYVCLVFICL